MDSLRLIIRLIHPLFLLEGALLYILGMGIAHYLGKEISWTAGILGLAWVTLLQLGMLLLGAYFRALKKDQTPDQPAKREPGSSVTDELAENMALLLSLTSLTVLASLTVMLVQSVPTSGLLSLVMGIIFLVTFAFFSTPPRLEITGYGELAVSILIAFLIPIFGFVIQSGELHRIVAMATFPLVFLHLAMQVANELPHFAEDLKRGRRTLLIRMGWQNGMVMHNVLILMAYLLLALAASFSLPMFVALPVFLASPIGLLEIWQMWRIGSGGRPNWTALTLNALAMFGISAYLMTYAFWTH